MFLDVSTRTILRNLKTVSASTASRFFSYGLLEPELCWADLAEANRKLIYDYLASARGRRPDVVLKVDLTCIEKTGRALPFVWCFNHRFGVQLVVLHVSVGHLHLPLAERVYLGKRTTVALALELLALFPAATWPARVVVMADAGFGSKDFLLGTQDLGFKRVLVGMRCDRKLADGRALQQVSRGEQVTLHDLPELTLWASYCRVEREEGAKRFFVVSTFKASGSYLAKRYRLRWLIESFFQRVKHDFGLKEARLRTSSGMRLWVFFACLAFSIASSQRSSDDVSKKIAPSLAEAAHTALSRLFKETLLHSLMSEVDSLSLLPGMPRLKLVMHRCNS